MVVGPAERSVKSRKMRVFRRRAAPRQRQDSAAATAKISCMRRAFEDLGRRLLRKSVERLAADRDTCSVCHRTPLVGERVHVYANGSIACPLCLHVKTGEPERTELVHHSEFGHAVKPMARIAA